MLFRHALRNAAVPIVTVIGLGVALLIGGVVVTESVFTIPGLGRLTVDAVLARDYPTIQAVILLFSFVYVMINLAVDMLYTILDPKDPLLMADATILEPVLPASPAKPRRVSQIAAQPGRGVRRRRHRDRIADGAIGALARNHRSDGDQPDRTKQGPRRGNHDADGHRRTHQDDRQVRHGQPGT